MQKIKLSVVLPAKNESGSLKKLLPELKQLAQEAEIIVVDDGSSDETVEICKSEKITVVSHPYSLGNGAAIKTGARVAKGDILVFMDADGQHKPSDIIKLVQKMDEGYEMVVGARHMSSQASFLRKVANFFYNKFASVMTGYKIEDLTSGFRAARARHFRKFLYLLPNGFSYPTTSTMAFFRSGLAVGYVPITANQRLGKSHINILKDGLRFLLIILKVGALFSPMRLFLPVSSFLFLIGCLYYGYTYISSGRFTNMSALLFLATLFTFLMGIIAEHISALHYKGMDDDKRQTRRD